jgi:glutathione-regulated potassium-efflux system ancillary protein KefF
MPDILVLCAHPHLEASQVNRALLASAAGMGAHRVVVHDLYAAYPDYLIDVEAEQALLSATRLVVWQHPIHWYSMPPLMKLWIDEVLTFGWAYGPGGDALRGKDLWLVASAGGPEASYHPASYNRYFIDAFLTPYEQTATLCGMRFVPPLVLFGAHQLGGEALAKQAQLYAERLGSYPDWPEIAAMEPVADCVVPVDARPAAQAV